MMASVEDALKHVDPESGEAKRARRSLQEYFMGPRDVTRHSKWPRALRMHGSVTPKILIRTIAIGIWAAIITTIHQRVHPIDIHPIIATVLGLLVGFSLNLRSATAYERYMQGRMVWSKLNGISISLARNVWIHVIEREGELGKRDLLGKVSFINLIVAFAVALKHKVRFEPYIQYEDLHDLVSHLDTFAKTAGKPSPKRTHNSTFTNLKNMIRLAEANPRRELKRAKRPVGNLPLEVLSYMGAYLQSITDNGTLQAIATTKLVDNLQTLDDVLVTADRILNTPLPIAYVIVISQITWIYVITLPLQLVNIMGWVNVPVVIVAAYVILGMAAIGNEIENPFGQEVNDLPIELYCAQIAADVAIITSRPAPSMSDYAFHPKSKPLYPLSSKETKYWPDADVDEIRDALKTRAVSTKKSMWVRQSLAEGLEPLSQAQSVDGSTLNEQATRDMESIENEPTPVEPRPVEPREFGPVNSRTVVRWDESCADYGE
ncbi:UPF0187-domain-containing protein [Ophiobolus disseminans]|uniref:UPF0187-domain-containing protein n=1 Tax=Ophiobolus disseminans TaxID=1469910 RepID=A0A6A7A3Y9_9PLEO|nr:UPF0187-domain-containing protein [Ophiobolus disseminans]